MSAAMVLSVCTGLALAILCLALVLTALRVIIGPTLADRVLALDTMSAIAIGIVAVLGLRLHASYPVDIALALALVSFLATCAFARFIARRGTDGVDPQPAATTRADEGTP